MDDDALLALCRQTAGAVQQALERSGRWGLVDGSASQHHSDLAADVAALGVLRDAGVGVLSEESGVEGLDRPFVAVLDPLDGSTNAAHGLPWYACSICIVDAEGPRVALVRNLASGSEFAAVRGGGAWVEQGAGSRRALAPSGCAGLSDALVGLAGMPPRHLGWRQFRSYGAAALDLCAVAGGVLDAWVDCSHSRHGVWDYLAGWLVCREAGAVVQDVDGEELVHLDWSARRRPIAAATIELVDELGAALRAAEATVPAVGA